MKNKFLILFFLVITFFISVEKINALNKIIKTETKDKVMFIIDDNSKFSYSWSFPKNEYKKNYEEFDLGIKFNTINKDKINGLMDKKIKKQYVSFNYHGTLPSVATVKVPVTNFKDGDRLNLYYYDEKTEDITKIDSNILVMNGYVSFDIKHCSDYFLTMSIVKEASNENNSGVIIIGMIIVVVGLVGYTLFRGKK